MNLRKSIFLWVALCLSMRILAQNIGIEEIMESYRLGQLDRTLDSLTQNIGQYEGAEQIQAYRLLSLTYLALDRFGEASEAANKLLDLEPYYTPAWDDSEPFKRLIESLRSGQSTIVSASQQAETLEEAPVPVTLITEEMIEAIGARHEH